jgi:hypothetical protein
MTERFNQQSQSWPGLAPLSLNFADLIGLLSSFGEVFPVAVQRSPLS